MKLGRRIPWVLPVSAVALYWGLLAVFAGEITSDHLLYGGVILLLTPIEHRFLPLGVRPMEFALPFILTGALYDSQRYWGSAVRGIPHIAEPYLFEQRWFGVSTANGTLTLNEWFGLYLHPWLDFIAGGVYLTFIGVFVLLAAYFTRRIQYDTDPARTPAQRQWLARALVWSFLVVNVLGFVTWFLYPAAPPWYVETYGLDTIILDVPMNPARTVRFDALFGTSFFTGMYDAGSNPFGAIPSLHVSYPVISVVFAMRLGKLRLFTILFSSLVGFAAVYLNHHYLIDVLLGIVYGVVGATITLGGTSLLAARSALSGDRSD
ncbi:MAG TPA: phosphatase PAP2 family protein [Gemmatimonadetes bacterium]|nr:phosphatase PAP2 family protein [Gemmatimonadota bacterium]